MQAVTPKLGKGQYQVVYEDTYSGELHDAGLFDFVLFCVPAAEAARLMDDCQPRLSSIPRSVKYQPVWVVLLAFDHAIFTPFDVLVAEEKMHEPIQSCHRDSSRYTSQDPFQRRETSTMRHRGEIEDKKVGRMWGGHDPYIYRRPGPPQNTYGGAVDIWTVHLRPDWSEAHRNDMAPQVVEVTLKAFLMLLGMPNSQVRVIISEAKLREAGHPQPLSPKPPNFRCASLYPRPSSGKPATS